MKPHKRLNQPESCYWLIAHIPMAVPADMVDRLRQKGMRVVYRTYEQAAELCRQPPPKAPPTKPKSGFFT